MFKIGIQLKPRKALITIILILVLSIVFYYSFLQSDHRNIVLDLLSEWCISNNQIYKCLTKNSVLGLKQKMLRILMIISSTSFYGIPSLGMSLLGSSKMALYVKKCFSQNILLRSLVGNSWRSRETFSRLHCPQFNCSITNERFKNFKTLREGFIKKKKIREISLMVQAPPPPPKIREKIFFFI